MELSYLDSKKATIVKILYKNLFLKYLKRVSFISIQDEDRKNAFLKQIKTKTPIKILPVGIDGEKNFTKSNYLRDLFSIPENKKIILYSGSITSWAMVYEIVQNAIHWKKDKCLVINGWIVGREYYDAIVSLAAKSDNIYINTSPVKWEDLDNFIASADIALALYRDSDINTQAISSSSNKLGVYSKSGIPVIINHTFSTKKMFEILKWGEGIESENDLENKIDKIYEQYSLYRNNAFAAFDKFYNLNLLSKELIDFLVN